MGWGDDFSFKAGPQGEIDASFEQHALSFGLSVSSDSSKEEM